MGARWYDPALGRWTQPDSLVPNPYNPLDWDRYAYVRNNSIKYVDPSGHSVDCGIGEFGCEAGKLSKAGIAKLYDDTYDLDFIRRNPQHWTTEQWKIWNNVITEMAIADTPEGHWEWEPDWVSVAIDIIGILGDLGLASGTPPGLLLDVVATMTEFLGWTKSWDDLDMGNPSGVIMGLFAVALKDSRIYPGVGSVASGIDLILSLLPEYVIDEQHR